MAHPYKARPVAATHVWLTPPNMQGALGRFRLDPCAAPAPRPWDTADEMWTLPQDGLTNAWSGRVWLNPPYGRETGKWLKKLAEHDFGTALVFARTETAMFRDYVWRCARALLFLYGRPHFHHPDGSRAKGNSGGPLVLVAYGHFDASMLRESGLAGRFVDL